MKNYIILLIIILILICILYIINNYIFLIYHKVDNLTNKYIENFINNNI
jgi:predicted Holliday junction resolvase-like endonuclease